MSHANSHEKRKAEIGGIVKAVISGHTNKTSNYICVLQASKDATQALHFPAKLEIGLAAETQVWPTVNTSGMSFSFRSRRGGGGAQDAAPMQGNKVHSTTSWPLAYGAMPPRRGAIGPPRDLAFRRSPTDGHGTTAQATVATTNQDGLTAGIGA